MTTSKTTTVLAQVLSLNADGFTKGDAKITADDLGGVKELRLWKSLIGQARVHAYKVYTLQTDLAMGHIDADSESMVSAMNDIYNDVRIILETIGTVNGVKLDPNGLVPLLVSSSVKYITQTVSNEAAHLDSQLEIARNESKLDPENEEKANAVNALKEQIKDLHKVEGNYKTITYMQGEVPFYKTACYTLGTLINQQIATPLDVILRCEAAKKAARKEAAARRKAARRQK